MKKIIYIFFFVLFIIACMYPFLRVDKDVDIKTLQKQIQELEKSSKLKLEDQKFIRRQFELNESDYQYMICYEAFSAMEVQELCAVRFESQEQKGRIMEKLQDRVEKRYKSFAGYAPRQASLLNKAILYEKGDYVILIVHEDAKYLKEKIDMLF